MHQNAEIARIQNFSGGYAPEPGASVLGRGYGAPPRPHPFDASSLLASRASLGASSLPHSLMYVRR